MKRNKQTITSLTKPQTLQILQIITKVIITSDLRVQAWKLDSPKMILQVRLPTNQLSKLCKSESFVH